MRIGFKKKDPGPATTEPAGAAEGPNGFWVRVILVLLILIKEAVFDLKELGADAFKDGIERLKTAFSTETDIRRLERLFEKQKDAIQSFFQRQKAYLLDREKEFRGIIDLLTRAMGVLDAENRDYNEKIYAQTEKIEEITLLDDIKKIKTALSREIEQIRLSVQEKQQQDRLRLEKLSNRVDTLNAELERARTESLTDGLTQVYNRKAFDEYLRRLVERSTVSASPFAMLILDLDDFKQVNDTHGHQTGDRVLLTLAGKCKEQIRSDDFLARYGGEEFVILLPGATLRDATKKARRLCKGIGSTRYFKADAADGAGLSLTVSIGVSAYRAADTAGTLTERADQALYAAKRAGKNRVVTEKDLPG